MEKFVCVRLVQANSLDLGLFQFDYDMSFAAFFLTADKTILGRYGTRSAKPKEADKDISLEGLRGAMQAALALNTDANRQKYAEGLAAKRGAQPDKATPQDFPSLTKFKPKLDYQGKLAQSCIHCHQIADAQRLEFRNVGKPIPDKVLFPWPNPSIVGIEFRKDQRATVARVAAGSAAAQAGLRAGDQISLLDGQPIVSVADVQWVLHEAGDAASIKVGVNRGSQIIGLKLELHKGWRRESDISWRTSSWELRRMAAGGMLLVREAGANPGKLSLRTKHVGQYGEHAVAKRAGVVNGDLLIEFDGHSDDWTESQLFTYAMQKRKRGDVVPIKVKRGSNILEMKIEMQ
ncbi:MAG: serine protease Do [Verrucomicrobiales bacterium]|jgi:serine protease Do